MCLLLMSAWGGGKSPDASLRDGCPSPRRHMEIGQRQASWTELERTHIQFCERCRNIQLELFRQQPTQLRGLIADDESHALKFLQVALRELNAELTPVQDGDAALQRAREALDEEQPYHFFLLDYKMPGLRGSDVAEQLRSSGYAQPPMMIWTEWSENEELQEQCRRHQFTLLCKNQLNKHRLARYVESALAGLPPAAQLAG